MVLEMLGSCTWEYLIPLLKAGVVMITSVPKEVEVLTEEREKIGVRIREADRVAAAAEEGESREGMKRRAAQLRTIDFRIEDVIDEWNSCLLHEREIAKINNKEEGQPHDRDHGHGCVAFPCENPNLVNIMCYDRLRIALNVQRIKSDLSEISKRTEEENKSSSEQVQDQEKSSNSTSTRNPDVTWKKLQRNPTISEDQTKTTVGFAFEAASDKLIGWLEDGRTECTVMVVAGMPGQGKTILAKKIFHNEKVVERFECSAWINVSDYDDPKQFFRFMLQQFYDQVEESPPYGLPTMVLQSLKKEVKKYLRKKRFVLFFDDVWNKNFWREIEHAVSDNRNGSRIIITTRNKEVGKACQIATIAEVHEMQLLTEKESLELFRQTVSRPGSKRGLSPKQIKELSSEIYERCKGLPLGIVTIGKHVSVHQKDAFKWKSKIEETGITKTFCLSYDNLPHHLQPCFLYFGIYPQDYEVKSKRLIRQWIAEGFVKYEMKKTLEEVAEEYLTSLVDRNLVQVSSFTIDGKPRSCHVHYLVHDMILRKFEDLSFCRCINEDSHSQPDESKLTRRLSIATNSIEDLPKFFDDIADKIESPFIRSLHFFTKEKLPEPFVRRIPAKYRSLKVLDFEKSQLSYVVENLGNLINLKYLSFRHADIQSLPKSIGELQNLETLDIRQTGVNELPKEVSKLRKLQHLLALVQLKDGIGGMRSLQTLRGVKIDDGGGSDSVGLIEKELGKLWQIRDFRLSNVGEEHGSALCCSINKMQHLEKLHIVAKSENEVIGLQGLKKLPMLQKLRLKGKLNKLPEWVPDLVRLVKLILSGSKLTDDPLNSLKDIPNLLFLSLTNDAYEGEILHFQDGDFENLEELELGSLHGLSSITIDSKALTSLKKLELRDIPQLKTAPHGIQHLEKLEDLNIQNMPTEFEQSIAPDRGQELQIIKHVPHVELMVSS